MEQGDIVKARCNRCSGERNHFIIHVDEEEWSEDLGDEAFISGKDRYELLKCAGSVTFDCGIRIGFQSTKTSTVSRSRLLLTTRLLQFGRSLLGLAL